MRHTWKIAAVVAAWASLGVAGCATTPDDPVDEVNQSMMTPEDDLAEESADEALMSSEEMTDEDAAALAAQPIGPPIGPPIVPGRRFRPPVCRHGSRLRPVGRGYICVGPGPFNPLPFCPGPWRLTRVGRGYLCERSFGPPHRPF